MNPSEIASSLRGWFGNRHTRAVDMIERSPAIENERYESKIVHEFVFCPRDPHEMQVEVWISEEGLVGIGFDRLSRTAQLAGYKSKSQRFVGGKEPGPMSKEVLFQLLNLVAEGKIAVRLFSLPIFGVISARLALDPIEIEKLSELGFLHASHHFLDARRRRLFSSEVVFKKWT